MDLNHRKQIHHIDQPGLCHLLTFSCYRRQPLLTNDLWNRWLAAGIDRSTGRLGFQLLAFVFMPEHVHLLVSSERPEAQVSQLLFAIKRPFAFRVKRDLEAAGSPLLRQLTVRERLGKSSFRFWQEGPGHDRNLVSERSVVAAVEYIHRNPVRRGLCESVEGWRWSSWRLYEEASSGSGQIRSVPERSGHLS